ncbi:hypothetical protein [Tuwongella immobilis]|uniref:DUF3352 domain-containing protein n=1 Tax=Tuwongella immobilis TaxID=692036 RepID=A0A6C2YMK0_9BACT|nr:hypothetical protein [Tuwongella immobilis]VIP02587.1 unnamed protein product [Tuwongella immobilis]VTS01849.1 unnamed protein product [Tuwongella immobilis]
MPRMYAVRRMVLGLTLVLGLALPVRAADFEALLPESVDSVVHLKISELMNSPLAKKYVVPMLKDGLENNAQANAAFQGMGLDPLKDFDSITIGSISGESPEDLDLVILLRGTFDVNKLNVAMKAASAAESEKIAMVKDGKLSFYKLTMETGTPISEMYMNIADGKTIVMTSKKERIASTQAKLGGTSKLNKEVATLLKNAGDSTLTIVGLNKSKNSPLPIPNPQAAQLLEKIDSLTMGIGMTETVSLSFGIGFSEEDEAKSIGEMLGVYVPQVKQFAGIFALQKPALKAPLDSLADSIKYSVKGKNVSLSLKTSAANIETIVREMAKQGRNDD